MDLSFSSMFSALLVSTIGAGMLLYGKKAEKPLYMAVGLGMCIYPYFIPNPWVLWAVTAAMLIPLYKLRNSF